jgi:hypothetical protein
MNMHQMLLLVDAPSVSPRISYIEWINAVSVVVLVGVTAYYAWTTRKILRESEKMRIAAEKQATASAGQANAAFATLDLLRQQFEDLQGLGASIVRTTIDSAVEQIAQWKKLDIKSNFISAEAYPAPELVPKNSQGALEHARRVSDECVTLLRSAFDDLSAAQIQIEILRKGSAVRQTSYFDPGPHDPGPMLTSAFSKLQDVRKLVS